MHSKRPPLYTVMVDLTAWSLDRTAAIPKSHRFTFGQRLDNLTLDALMGVVRALYSPRDKRAAILREFNLQLEQLRVLWRLVCDRRWITQAQLLHVNELVDEAGRMAGGWLRHDGKTEQGQTETLPQS